ncbi:MAG: oligosaccharide flippase family protein [Synechococcales cyanobacterium CRU_2_2]|nr:oligosaccharide flippase family protein [Synechococcales cyanobacterium CRU_2_2]
MKALKRPAVRGTLWIIANYGVSQSLRFGSNLILTHLLVPEYFGLMALANTLRIGLELMSDLGIDQSIIQNQRGDDPDFLNTAWTIKIVRGFLLWFVCLAVTMPVAHFYEDNRLYLIIPIIGLTTILEGFTSTSLATLNRRMELGVFTIFEWMIQIFSLTVLITWSWLSPSIWALSIGSLSGIVFQMVASHFLLPHYHNHLMWDREAFKVIFAFGKGMFLATALMFLADQADRFLLSKMMSFELLGVYTVALTLATLPREVLKNLSYRVLFPTAAKNAELPRSALQAATIQQRWLILLGTAVVLAIMTSFGDFPIRLLYDDRYHDASWMMPILSFGVWFSALFYTATPALLALGHPIYTAYSNLGRLTMVMFGLWLGFRWGGIQGAIMGLSLSDLFSYLVLYYGLWREQLLFVVQDLKLTSFFLGLLVLLLGIRFSLGWGWPIQEIL